MDGFDWPQRFGLGLVYEFRYDFRVAADVDWIEWSEAVDRVVLSGGPQDIVVDMDWNDQWVYAVGAEWEFAEGWLVRAGYNHADSPVPNRTLSPLFPAIVEDHYTVGFGYDISDSSEVNFSLQYAPEVSQTNSTFGYTVEHSQTSWQLMYSAHF